MFDGAQDQYNKFLASSSRPPPPPHHPLTFSLYGPNSPYDIILPPPPPPLPPPPPHVQIHAMQEPLMMLHQHGHCKEEKQLGIMSLFSESSIVEVVPWSNEEVLALLRIRYSLENHGNGCWFPADFTWQHVSRKLGELGFKRSAQKCKEKFEEESRYLNSINCNAENYRLFGELENLYEGEHHHHQGHGPSSHHHDHNQNDQDDGLGSEGDQDDKIEDDTRCDDLEKVAVEKEREEQEEEGKKYVLLRKRKRERKKKKLEMFKGFCENIVNKMMAHQEELHNKFLEDMVKRDEEKIAREEAWRKQEMERINKEMDLRAHEQALACDRQAKIIEFLKKVTSSSTNDVKSTTMFDHDHNMSQSQSQMCLALVEKTKTQEDSHDHQNITKVPKSNTPSTPTSCNTLVVQNSTLFPSQDSPNLPTSSNDENQASSSNPNSIPYTKNNPITPCKSSENPSGINEEIGDQDVGKRWPRDEVLALINIRCSLYKKGEHRDDHHKDDQNNGTSSSSRGPLWERISRRMLDLGYKRSAKRCKEKWENINKYFRKTKDMNKKRSLDSRTCPYFHQLSYLYSQGTIVSPPENHLALPENQSEDGDHEHGSPHS